MSKNEAIKLPTMDEVKSAIAEVQQAMIENIEAAQAEIGAVERKRKARYVLSKAKDRLRGLEMELMAL